MNGQQSGMPDNPGMFEIIPERHKQFMAQAEWTCAIRVYLADRINLSPTSLCLEIGCGTGVILKEWEQSHQAAWGIDFDLPSLRFATGQIKSRLSAADAAHLPFPENAFDCIFSHFFFLWVRQPGEVLREIWRCLKPGGHLLIFAEPDYGGRMDYPQELEIIKEIQLAGLRNQGADPMIGRKMKSHLSASGFHAIRGGILGSEWQDEPVIGSPSNTDMENILYDLSSSGLRYDARQLAALDQQARLEGSRITFVPTFYYSAQK
jgi:SAM-dependent methyltransferase